MLIEKYDLGIFTPPCDPGAERFAARARLQVDISAVLPYLNATLRGAVYHKGANSITWKKGGHNIAFHPYEIATSNVEDRNGAINEIKGLVDLVNRTWERRAEIKPSEETKRRPKPMQIYQLLPKTNCKKCGEATCIAFAAGLILGKRSPNECTPLQHEVSLAENKAALEAIL